MQPRVLHVIDHTAEGGAQVVVLRLLRALRKQISFSVAVLGKSGRFSQAYEALGVPVFTLGKAESRWSAKPILKLVKLIRDQRIELVHTHLFRSHILGVLASKWTGSRTMIHDHSGIYPEGLSYYFPNRVFSCCYRMVYKWALKRSDRVVVLTSSDVASYLQFYGLQSRLVMELPNAVDIDEFTAPSLSPQKATIKCQLRLTNDSKVIIMIGRLEPVKDWFTFLDVAKHVQSRSTESCAFLIVGTGSLEKILRKYVNDHHIEQVFFLGYRQDIQQLLKGADVLLLTSRREAFSLVLLEAMASGCPIVATRTVGPQAIITHEVDGLLSPIGDVASLSNHVLRLMYDKSFAQMIVSNAMRTVIERYELKSIAARLTQIYKDVLVDRNI